MKKKLTDLKNDIIVYTPLLLREKSKLCVLLFKQIIKINIYQAIPDIL